MQSKRNSNYELLRILSMLLIVAWHYSTQFSENGTGILDQGMSFYHLFAIVFGSWGQVGVDLFIIISVYFLRQSNRFRCAKAIDLVFETIAYGIIWALVCVLVVKPLSRTEILTGVFGLFLGKNWFIFAYLLLYIFHPILNNIIDKMTDSMLKKTALLLTIFVSGIKTIYHDLPICDFLFMVNIYFVVSCIERSELEKLFEKKAKTWLLITVTALVALQIVLVFLGERFNSQFLITHNYYFNMRGSIFILFTALCVFYLVKPRQPRNSRIVNHIASTCFGIFLSHQFLGYHFWYKVFYYIDDNEFLACVHMIISVVVIFAACSFIDLVRQNTIGYIFRRTMQTKHITAKTDAIDAYMNGRET